MEDKRIRPDWWSKSLAAVFLGLLLTYGIIALFAWFGPDNLNQTLSSERAMWRTQFNMWMVPPIWLLIISFSYLFQTGLRAWVSLGAVNLIVYSILMIHWVL
jgi:hypothetical protein